MKTTNNPPENPPETMKQKLRDALRILLTPSCWLQNYRYSKKWDQHLRALLAKHRFTNITEYTANLGGVNIWISNHPYASMRPYDIRVRPGRVTILDAHEKLIGDSIDAMDEMLLARQKGAQ